MTISASGRLRRMAYLVVWVLALIVAACALGLLHLQHRSTVGDLLEQHRLAQELSWQAIRSQQGNSVVAFFDQYVMDPVTLDWLARAQDSAQREEARRGLERHLEAVYRELRDRGVHHVQFHLPDGESLLRLHQPERHGDGLFEVRESIRRVNQTLEPVFGFELGRTAFGHRNVFPVVDAEGRHLGSAELSVHYRILLRELRALWPGHDFELILRQELAREVLFDEEQLLLQPWAGSSLFVIEGAVGQPNRGLPVKVDSPRSRQLAETVSTDPALRARVEAAHSDVFRVQVGGLDHVVTQTPLVDLGGRLIGLLMAYAPEPALARLDAGLRVNAGLSVAAILVLGVVSHWLLVIAAQKFGERERLGLITRSLGQGLYVLDGTGVITEVNPRACQLLGYASDELIGQRAQVFHSHPEKGTAEERACPIISATSRGERFTGEQCFRRKDGEILDVSVTSVPLVDQGGSVTLFDDITRQKDNERQLRHIAHFDALTGLPNRVLLADRLGLAMARARRSGSRLALAFLDLDGFKAVNDNHGHEVGDRLLVRLARRMQASLRETDTVARLGGDEFAVVLTDISDLSSYAQLLDRLLLSIAKPEVIEGNELLVSASIGVSLYPQDEDIDADQLLRQADQAMYEAKLAGKNRYRVFDVARDSDLRGRHEQVERLRCGLEAGEFRLYYQPWVKLNSGKVQGLEALVRWQHPQRGLLHPTEFLPLISRQALEIDLGRWVINTALKQMDSWRRQGLDLSISINIAGDHLQHPGFVDELRSALGNWPLLRPGRLQLEVVESSALEDIKQVSSVIEACTQLGVTVALDDFGTGYSSLTYLKRLPVRTLKLDQSFVRDMLHDPEDLAILDGVLNLARAFGLEAIAEGVETAEHGRILLQLGCELAQGFAIARPLPASGVQPWMQGWRVPEEWASSGRLEHEGREALYAQVEQRAWIRSLQAYLEGALSRAPELHPGRCRLGRRLHGGLARRGAAADRTALNEIHERIHRMAGELIDISRHQGRHAALARLDELKSLSAELDALLEALIQR